MVLIFLVGGIVLLSILATYFMDNHYADLYIYNIYGNTLQHGLLPYVDVRFEYPPLALVPIFFSQLLSSIIGNFYASYIFLSSVVFAVLINDRFRRGGWPAAKRLVWLCLPLLTLFLFELELYVVLVLYFCLVIVLNKDRLTTRRVGLAAVLFAVAALTKGYPLVCLPALALVLPTWRYRIQFVSIIGALGAAIVGALVVLAPRGAQFAYLYHMKRPLDIGSTAATVGLVLRYFGVHSIVYTSNQSWAVWYPGAVAVNTLSSVLLVGSLIFFTIWYFRRGRYTDPAVATLAAMAYFLLYIICVKIGSPQFILPVLFIGAVAYDYVPRKDARPLQYKLAFASIAVSASYMIGDKAAENGGWLAAPVFVLKLVVVVMLLRWVLAKITELSRAKPQPATSGQKPRRRPKRLLPA